MSYMLHEVVVVGSARTAIGNFLGSLKSVSAIELGVTALKGALAKAGLDAGEVEEVVAGNCIQAGSPGNVARHIGLRSGVPVEAPGMTVNQQCPSSMRAAEIVAQQIMLGKIRTGAVVGTESMTNAPYLLMKARFGYRMGSGDTVQDALLYNGLACGFIKDHMGVTAENVAEMYHISRQEQDELALLSNRRALAAIREGRFKEEIVPVEVRAKNGTILFDTDEHPRDTTLEKLAQLPTVFKKDGTVTPGNSSGVNDGAAALILMAADKAKELGVKPLARIVSTASAGVDPQVMGMGVVPAVKQALQFANLKQKEIGYWEINEAFAAQFLGVNRELKISLDRVNGNGSGIGLGHPVGNTGARLIVSLIYEMRSRGVRYGCASLCAGGGPAAATVVEVL
jgi:acetyl-CoA acetyltransferases